MITAHDLIDLVEILNKMPDSLEATQRVPFVKAKFGETRFHQLCQLSVFDALKMLTFRDIVVIHNVLNGKDQNLNL